MTVQLVDERPSTLGLGRMARRRVLKVLGALRCGRLELVEGSRRHAFGSGLGQPAQLWVHDAAFWSEVAFGGSVGFGESFVRGHWSSPDLVPLLRLLHQNQPVVSEADAGAALGRRVTDAIGHALRRNTLAGSRANIAAHYDQGNDFFELVLDPTLSYSCALFDDPNMDLAEASRAKIERVLALLEVEADTDLLDLGCGWGALSERAALRGARVTATTISAAQHGHVRKRLAGAELPARVLSDDWRRLRGSFDAIACIEMIEAVGYQYYDAFFQRCSELMTPGGRLVLQAIVIGDDRFEWSKRRADFVKKHVFPGSCLPSRAALHASIAKTGCFSHVLEQDLTKHYPTTLAAWRRRLLAQDAQLEARGYAPGVRRAWEYYLAYCEAAFAERHIENVLWVLVRR